MLLTRFIFIFLACLIILGLLSRMTDDSDARWTTGAAVWGGAFALSVVDHFARLRQ